MLAHVVVRSGQASERPAEIRIVVDGPQIGGDRFFFLAQRGKSEDFRIIKSFFSPIPKVLIDPNSIEQAFLNIILNAQKAMPRGGTLTVSTRFLNSQNVGQGEVQIIFEDTGVGIRKENLHKIFDPFFSTRSDGTGLGLSITKNIIEQYQGKIEVESQVNVGTKFIITLPAINAERRAHGA